MEEIKYDIKRGAEIYRAIYGSRLKNWILTGKIKRGEILVWRSGLSGWRRAEELEELMPFFEKEERTELRRIEKKRPRKQIMPLKKQIKNILIIDDEKDLCSLLYDALMSKKYNVAIANTKKEAIASLKRKLPDLVLLDLKLPDGDGMNLLSKIKKVSPETIINIISAYGDEKRREEAKKKGAHSFIDKPFTDRDIFKSIKQISRPPIR